MSNAISLHDLQEKAEMPANQAGGMATVKQYFKVNQQALAEVLPKHINPERMMRLALGAIRTTPGLLECTTESLMGAIVVAAQFGLEPNSPLQQCFLIPYNNSVWVNGKSVKRKDVQFQLGYRGVIELVRRSGEVNSIQAMAVYSEDYFDYEFGTNDRLSHKPEMFGDRGELQGFYAYAHLKDGGMQVAIMGKAEVDKIMQGSQAWQNAEKRWNNKPAKKNSPWHLHYDEMGKKTVIKRLAKLLPQSIESAKAIALDHQHETGSDQELSAALEGDFVVKDTESPELLEDQIQSDPPANMNPETGEVPAPAPEKPKPAARKKTTKKTASKPAPGPQAQEQVPEMPEGPPADTYDDGPDGGAAPAPQQGGDLPNLS